MITDIMQNEGDYFRVRFVYESTLSLCEVLGFLAEIMCDDRFYKALPLITIIVNDVEEIITFDAFKNKWVEEEMCGIMKRCGFELEGKVYYEHTGRTTHAWRIKWKKKEV